MKRKLSILLRRIVLICGLLAVYPPFLLQAEITESPSTKEWSVTLVEGVTRAAVSDGAAYTVSSSGHRCDQLFLDGIQEPLSNPADKRSILASGVKVIYGESGSAGSGGKTRYAYCLEYQKATPTAGQTYRRYSWGNRLSLLYVLDHGARYLGEYNTDSRYSVGQKSNDGDWIVDYFVTQMALHIVNGEFTLSDFQKAITGQYGPVRGAGCRWAETGSARETYGHLIYGAVQQLVNDAVACENKGGGTQYGYMDGQFIDLSQVEVHTGYVNQWQWDAGIGAYRTPDFQPFFTQNGTWFNNYLDSVSVTCTNPDVTCVTVNDSGGTIKTLYLKTDYMGLQSLAREGAVLTVTGRGWSQWGGGKYRTSQLNGDGNKAQDILALVCRTEKGKGTVSGTSAVLADAGTIEIYKSSSVPSEPGKMEGAEYTIYRQGTKEAVGKIIIDAQGYGISSGLAVGETAGKYEVQETKAPEGYCLDPMSYPVSLLTAKQKVTLRLTDQPAKGNLEIRKNSANPKVTERNSRYSLEDAEYTVYRAGTDLAVGTICTDKNGCGRIENVTSGIYEVKETKAPKGYVLDSSRHTVTVQGNTTAVYTTEEVPKSIEAGLILLKQDTETETAQGSATLAGAIYAVKYYDVEMEKDPAKVGIRPKYSWMMETDDKGQIVLDVQHQKGGDPLIMDEKLNCALLPLGTLTIEEVQASEGYLVNRTVYVAQVTEKESTADLLHLPNTRKSAAEEQVKRGDLEFTKIDAETGNPMGGIPFTITSLTTGEIHEVMTDENGYISTAADWNPHTKNTNAGQKSEDGVWFGTGRPDNDRGALPYDTYLIEETLCPANYGKDPIEFQVVISENGKIVDKGRVFNQAIQIRTKGSVEDIELLRGQDLKQIKITDVFYYENLTPQREYVIKGCVRDPKTGDILMQEGIPLIIERKFRPAETKGNIPLTFVVDGMALQGKRVVVTETLSYKGKEIAKHEDLQDPDQTLSILTGDLTVIKKIAVDDIYWEHGDPCFTVKLTGTTLNGTPAVFFHTYHFTEDFVKINQAEDGYVKMAYTFQEIPLSENYKIEEIPVSRYRMEHTEEKRDTSINLVNQPKGAVMEIENKKTNEAGLSHTAVLHNVLTE